MIRSATLGLCGDSMGVRFNGQACADFLYLNLVGAMKQLQQELLAQAQQGMLTPEGRDSLHDDDIKEIAGVIVASISGGAWAAMDEHGTGHMMDRGNPALKDYMGGSLWNPQRMGYTVVGRPAGTYTNIFGEKVTSKGKREGQEIEFPEYKGKHPFVPHPPSHAMQTAVRWMANGRMRQLIQTTVKSFPFNKFIVTDKK